VLQGLPQVPPFAELAEDAREADVDGLPIRVCSLDALLAMKRASERTRDRDDLEALEAGHPRTD
jgi:predicted nucleotidyltransferase